ncbi:MAG: ATP synthase F1 subunit delta [Candidatus Cyclobacteriaceae bacterium M3_2C_046]
MSNFKVAYRYAKSLLELARDKGKLDAVNRDMVLFSQVCQANRDFMLMLKNPVIKHDKKYKILVSIFKGKIDDLTLAIFEITTRKSRENLLPEVASVFHKEYNQLKGIAEASLTTQFKIDEPLRNQFREIIKDISGSKSVELSEKTSPELIGGYILKIGDKQIDDSINTKLKELAISLKS